MEGVSKFDRVNLTSIHLFEKLFAIGFNKDESLQHWKKLILPSGFEPELKAPKASVLPLHHGRMIQN